MKSLVFVMLLVLLAAPAAAQDAAVPYVWKEGDIALSYPAGWDVPFAFEDDDDLVLVLAQVSAAEPDVRPPAAQVITLTLLTDIAPDASLAQPLADALFAQGTPQLTDTSDTMLAGGSGMSAQGFSEDGVLFGAAQVARLSSGQVLVVAGRALTTHQDSFLNLVDHVSRSLTPGADRAPTAPRYGTLWRLTDSGYALGALTEASNNTLYALSPNALVELDTLTGETRAAYERDSLAGASDIAVDSEGVVYVASPACTCVRLFGAGGEPQGSIGGFSASAPTSIAVSSDGVVYATDGAAVRVLASGDLIPLPDSDAQPLLALDRGGRLLALAADGGVYALDEQRFAPLFQLADALTVRDMAVDLNNNLVLATSDGVVVVNSAGETAERLTDAEARGVVVSAEGTVYYTDSEGTLTALSTRVLPERVGDVALVPGAAVQGLLNPQLTEQAWTYEGLAGERLTISAVEVSRAGVLDVSLRLIAPDGSEEAANDDHGGADLYSIYDAQIVDHALATSGTYTIMVERVDGDGVYSLGVSVAGSFQVSADGVNRLDGALADSVPMQRWWFDGEAGQVFTITMRADSATLDPLLRLIDPDGNVLVENDDARDPEMGTNAQIVLVQLPTSGSYVLEAGRFDGAGRFSIVMVATS